MRGACVHVAWLGVGCAVGTGPVCHAQQWWWPPTNGTLMNPPCPSPMAPIWLGVSGNFPDTCVPNAVSVVRTGSEFDLNFSTTPPTTCTPIFSPWAMVASLGPLPEGSYPVYATYARDGATITPRVLIRTITVSPTCPAACYPNCDGSTTAPYLNVSDFSCFLEKFAGGDLYANCDGSTQPPVLNFSDFACFLNRYAGGCH